MKRRYNYTHLNEYQMSGSVCFYCKEPTEYESITIDHVLPRNRGFLLTKNSVFACEFCNSKKGGFTIYQFREYLCHMFSFYVRHNKNEKRCRKILTAIKTCTELLNDKDSIIYSEKIKCGRGRGKLGRQKAYIPQTHDIIKPPFNGYKDVHVTKLMNYV